MATCSGYTALSCVAARCGIGDPATVGAEVVEELGAVVRAGTNGVLVSTGCFLGAGCAARPVAPVVVVQPCDDGRSPTSCALLIGPMRTTADVAAFGAWLRAGDLDPRLLPAHLLDAARRVGARRA
ncbi:hypothetical protein [Pseudonocardia abyssalis]|uniref:TIR domain-containing protein n=1 Tax=Pseudonocardia abyssalis TaxID=2792008 RepID=A0ABS6USE9_9PSEU|nr:hypothetical protein [Pseudonocardia abyssalis]MBW0118574.1 hypothetical protein [Pseudonocardia abyssalis]MBW0135170.1 hypothetical protein [Pseudonocardia abyssalis]